MNSIGKIAVIVPQISSNIETNLIDSIHSIAANYGYDTIVISAVINYIDLHLENIYTKGQTNIYDIILHGGFDGYIFEANIFCSEKQRKAILNLLRKVSKPCVVINYEQPYFPVVSADETTLLYLSTQHLIKEHGCKKMFCIGGNQGHLPSEERIKGFRIAMDENKLPYDENDIFYGDYWKEVPRKIAIDIADGKLDKPDGVICGNDIMAQTLSRTLIEHGIRVPDDIKITGCDGSIISQTEQISFTTVANQERINGFLAISKLLEIIGIQICENKITPELIIGESCGCTEINKSENSRARLDIREYAGVTFETLEHRKTNSHGEIIRRMSECRNLNDVLETFLSCRYMIPTGIKAELCLCEDWCRSMRDPSVYRRGGLSDKMLLGIEADSECCEKMIGFMTRDIFPSLNKPHEPRLTVISSLHYKGQIFGYLGFTYKKAVHIIFDDFYMSWCDAVSSGLNSVQNRLYKEYINKRIESLSEFAPVLGIYNKRGLISKLMSMIADDNSSALTLSLFSYIKEERTHYNVPPVNAIVNAIRLKNDKAVLASLGDDIIASASVSEYTENTEESFIDMAIKSVRDSYTGAVEIKKERIIVVTCTIVPSDIFSIDSLITDMADNLKGKIISLGSGIFSYNDRFIALRNEIYAHPEKEWNIESTGRSLGVSKSHFHRIYKGLFDTSCKEDIISSRVKKAKWFLENTSLPVSQIAEQCGYANNSHFIRQFSERIGQTPSDYRKNKSFKE